MSIERPFCQNLSINLLSIGIPSCDWVFKGEGCPLLFGLSRSESMVISSVSLILGEFIGRFLFLVGVVDKGDVSMFSIIADWLIYRVGIVLEGVATVVFIMMFLNFTK